MLRYKIDVLAELKKRGFSTYVLRQKKIFGESTISLLRAGLVSDARVLDRLCELLHRQPGQLVEWVPDPGPEA